MSVMQSLHQSTLFYSKLTYLAQYTDEYDCPLCGSTNRLPNQIDIRMP